MEESVTVLKTAEEPAAADLQTIVDHYCGLPQKDWMQYSPLTLAWIGDTVFDLIVRTVLVKQANMQTEKLHRQAVALVNARMQAEGALRIRASFSAEEEAVYRRGRNSNPHHNAKNADREQYLEATGFEALLGYLYLRRRYSRIMELVKAAYPAL